MANQSTLPPANICAWCGQPGMATVVHGNCPGPSGLPMVPVPKSADTWLNELEARLQEVERALQEVIRWLGMGATQA